MSLTAAVCAWGAGTALQSPLEQANGFFGRTVAGVPDITGDGRGEVVIGALGENSGRGRVHVYNGYTTAYMYTLDSPNLPNADEFGIAIDAVPAIDGASAVGLAVGDWLEDGLSLNEPGFVHVFILQSLSAMWLKTVSSPAPENFGHFGHAVAGIEDLDSDNRGDLVVGARREDPPSKPVDSGRVHLMNAVSGALIRSLSSPNAETGGEFGFAVAVLPDTGTDAVVVGAYGEDVDGLTPDSGRVYVFDADTGAVLLTLVSPNPESGGYFGSAVAGMPDVTGDGRGEVVVGAHYEDGAGFADSGRAYVFDGSTGALLHELVSPGAQNGGEFGDSVAGVADADGNGYADIIVGARLENDGAVPLAGKAYVFDGNTGLLLQTLKSSTPQNQGRFGNMVAGLPDINGDGLGDAIVGARQENPGGSPTNAGRAYLFVPLPVEQWERYLGPAGR